MRNFKFYAAALAAVTAVVAGHAKRKKLTRKIQKNLLLVKNKPLEQKTRGLNHFIVRISDIPQSRTVQISYKSGNLI